MLWNRCCRQEQEQSWHACVHVCTCAQSKWAERGHNQLFSVKMGGNSCPTVADWLNRWNNLNGIFTLLQMVISNDCQIRSKSNRCKIIYTA